MKLHNKEEKIKTSSKSQTTKEISLESKINQQNSKISHLLEKIEQLQKNNEYVTLLLEELLYTISKDSPMNMEIKEKNNNKNNELQILQQLIKLH